MEFFNVDDIIYFSDIAGKTYRSNDVQSIQKREVIKNGVWGKTKQWADLLRIRLGKEYKVDFRMSWGQRGWENSERVSTFKRYTWARVYKAQDTNKDIYYTIGVDGLSKRLIIKLDYQRHGKTILTTDQAQRAHEFIRPDIEKYWVSIPIVDLDNKLTSWDVLLTKTVATIHDYSFFYDDVINQVWLNEVRLARVAYNTANWICPSGTYGKSTHPSTHEAKYGYGYEEWLFDFNKRIDGHHYAFLEPLRENIYQGNTYDIWLYTINSKTKERFWVGHIRNVEVLTPDQIHHAWNEYNHNGWLDEMRQQINTVYIDQKDFSDYVGNAIFNARFRPEDANIYPELIKAVDNAFKDLKHYKLYGIKNVILPEAVQEESFKFVAGEHRVGNNSALLAYDRQPKTIQLARQHSELSHKVYGYLVNMYGDYNVGTEILTPYNTAIDIVRRDGEDYYFYEIKTHPSLKQCIREALGQIIEYSYWPDQQIAKELVIVSSHPVTQQVKEYIANLRNRLKLPITYQQFVLSTNQLQVDE